MYHIVVVSTNQEESPLLQRLRQAFALKKSAVNFRFCHHPELLRQTLAEVHPDYVLIDTDYSDVEQLTRLEVVAEYVRQHKRLVPVIYLLDWHLPSAVILGTSWGGKVGILHTFSSSSEIIDLFQRLDGWGVTVGQ